MHDYNSNNEHTIIQSKNKTAVSSEGLIHAIYQFLSNKKRHYGLIIYNLTKIFNDSVWSSEVMMNKSQTLPLY